MLAPNFAALEHARQANGIGSVNVTTVLMVCEILKLSLRFMEYRIAGTPLLLRLDCDPAGNQVIRSGI